MAPKGNHVKTQSMKFTGHLTIEAYIDFKNESPLPLKVTLELILIFK